MVDHVIFDLDGTLIDSAAICTEILNSMLRDRGCDRVISTVEATPYLSRGGSFMVSGLLGDFCDDPANDLAEFRRRYADLPTPPGSLFNGVRAGLHELAESGYGLVICSNKPQDLCEKVLGDVGLASLFNVIVGTRTGVRPKPHTDLIELTFRGLHSNADRCLFVGDSDLDQRIADAAGVPFLYVSYGYACPEWSTDGLETFDCFGELVQSVKLTHGGDRLRRVA